MEFALDLAKRYGTDPRITKLLDTVRVYVFPVINPDGFVDSRGEIPLLDPLPGAELRCQRKNAHEGRPEPQLRRVLGRQRREHRPANDTYRGPGAVVGAREPGRPRVLPAPARSRTSRRSTTSPRSCCARRASSALGLAPDEDAAEARSATGWARPPATRPSTATSSTRSPARPRTGTTSPRTRSATRSSSGRRTRPARSRARTRPTSSSSTSATTGRTARRGRRARGAAARRRAGRPTRATTACSRARRPPGATLRLTRSFQTTTSRDLPAAVQRRQLGLPDDDRSAAPRRRPGDAAHRPGVAGASTWHVDAVDAAVRAQGRADRGVDDDVRRRRRRGCWPRSR